MAKASMICSPLIDFVFLFTLLLILLLASAPSTYSDEQTDFEALMAFKKAIRDDPTGALASWNQTTHFCKWNGVWCSEKHRNRVISISLRSRGLVGSLSPHVGNLSFLRKINLQNNMFHGQIPEEMGRLTKLGYLEFSFNSFGGGIPRNLSQCRDLYFINLVQNNLTGPIVPEIGSLVNLQALCLSDNPLSGTVPSFLGNLTRLIAVSLGDCGLHGGIPDSLVHLQRLEFLNLFENSLTGRVPSGLYNLSKINSFSLGANRLFGTIPSDIGFTLPQLRFLDLSANHFTGALPSSLSNSSLMQQLVVSGNNFTGNMIDITRFSSALYSLLAANNPLKGDINTILLPLTNNTTLQTLDLSSSLFTGSLSDSIGNLSRQLWYLNIDKNQLTGTIPSSIGNLVGLAFLSVANNDLEGSIPSSIGKLQQLHQIYFLANRLTNEIPSSFGNLTLLNLLALSWNHLSGIIPRSLGNCSSLQGLDLQRNNLEGSIPPEIMRLSSITMILDLSNNVLTGTIPLEVGALSNLGQLDLSHNRLSGEVPSSLSSCVMLEWLHLESNSLQGEILASLNGLGGLTDLDLSRNNFTGTIPTFIGEFPLLNLNLSFNSLSGEVPTIGVFRNESAVSLEGNQELCGGIATLNLPSCSPTKSTKKDFMKILIPTICLAALSACFCIVMYLRRKSRKVEISTVIFRAPEFLRLSYGDLVNATGGFSETNLVGKGKFGSVYRGSIINVVVNDDEQTVVAVKVLNLNERGASRSLELECNALRGIRHRNLLKILSVCDSINFQGENFKALVYEFMANGSLENWLHQNSNEEVRILSTIKRLDIAIDIACGVEYLHCSTNSTIVHGDLKPSNILLDEDMVAHVGDFGLARIISSISPNLSISIDGSSLASIKGTIGYIAPEYGMTNVVSTEGDAYSYGILLLEMFTNIRPTSDAFVNLQDFITTSSSPHHVMEAVDPFLHQELHRNVKYQVCVASVLRIGANCSKQFPRDRMSMAEVVIELKKIRNEFLAADSHARN